MSGLGLRLGLGLGLRLGLGLGLLIIQVATMLENKVKEDSRDPYRVHDEAHGAHYGHDDVHALPADYV